MKDYETMSLEELKEAYIEELNYYRESIPTNDKYLWLKKLVESDKLDYIKLRTARGYLMGLRDCGKGIGDLKLLLEFISIEVEG